MGAIERTAGILIICVGLLSHPLSSAGAVTSTTELATSPFGKVAAAELSCYLRRNLDSPYCLTEAADYLSTKGLRQAIADIVLERKLAELASLQGLDKTPTMQAQLAETRRAVLLEVAQERLRGQASVSEDQVAGYYREHRQEFTAPEQVRMRLFVVPRKTTTDESGRTRLEEIRAALAAKGMAEQISGFDDVSSGVVTARPGDFPPEVTRIIFSAKSGQHTPVFGRKNAWYLAHVIEHETTRVATLADVKESLRSALATEWLETRQRQIEAQLKSEMPLQMQRSILDRLGQEQLEPDSTVVGEVAGTSITLADIAVTSSSQPTRDTEQAIEDLARRIRVAKWAESHGIPDSPDFKVLFEQKSNRLLGDAMLRKQDRPTSPSEADLRSYFETHRGEFDLGTRWTVTELFSPHPMMDTTTSPTVNNQPLLGRRQILQAIRDKIAGGMSIENAVAVAETSATGSLRIIDQGTAEQGPRGHRLDKAVEHLRPGQVSAIEESRRGLHLYVVRDVLEPHKRSFEEARTDVEQAWQLEQVRTARQEFIDKLYGITRPTYHEQALDEFRETPGLMPGV